MSLLLDALKKAAKDKEASSVAKAREQQTESLSVLPESAAELEFSLDEAPASKADNEPLSNNEAELQAVIDPIPNTVSEEALQVLIYKTNHAHKRQRWVIWGGATFVSVLVLVISGLYFLNKIQQEVAVLEEKHRINMQVVQAEPVKTATTQPVANVSSVAAAETIQKRAVSQQQTVTTKPLHKKSSASNTVASTVHAPAARQQNASGAINVTMGEKRDPVGMLLTKAWSAYNRSDYAQANNLYAQVLEREKNNRDALMGLGAIALKNNDSAAALQYYNKLLQLDPRDPVANAAILNMNNSTSPDVLSESKLLYLLSLDPAAADLYYALGNKYSAQSKWPEAQAAYFSAFEHDSSSADYAYNLAVSLERLGRASVAVKYYNYALQLANNSNISFSPEVVRTRLEQIQP